MTEVEAARGQTQDDGTIEIRLSDAIASLKRNRWTIVSFALVGVVLGVLYAFSKADEYRSKVTVMPEIQAKGASLSGLSSLAGLAGVNLDNAGGTDVVRPNLYPTILESIPFGLYMLQQSVYSKEFGSVMPLQAYLKRHEQERWINRITNWSSSDSETPAKPVLIDPKNFSRTLQITGEQEGMVAGVLSQVKGDFDAKTGIFSIESRMADPVVAASATRLALDYLTSYVVAYRTEKSRQQATFLQKQVREASQRYQSSEYALESYRDRNRSLYSNVAKIEEQRLQAEYMLAQTVYNDLVKQLEQAKIKVQEETPVFKMLEPPRVPVSKSGPKRPLFIIALGIVGLLGGVAWAFGRDFLSGRFSRKEQ